MAEYLIRRTDGEWFDLHRDAYGSVFLRPKTDDRQVEGHGDYRFIRDGVEIEVNYEDPGLHIIVEDDAPSTKVESWLCEFVERLESVTGQDAELRWL